MERKISAEFWNPRYNLDFYLWLDANPKNTYSIKIVYTILPSNVNRKKGRIIIYMFKNWLKLVVLAILIEYLLGKNISQDSRSNWGVFNGPYIHYGKRKGNEQERRKM